MTRRHLILAARMPRRRRTASPTPVREFGLSLIELMIAVTLGLLIVAGITVLIARQSSTRAEFEKASRDIENGRYAMQLLKDDIEHAGFYDQYNPVGTVPATLPDPCETVSSNLAAALPLPLQGMDAPSSLTGVLSCLADGNHKPGTDILVIRRADTTAFIPVSSAVASQPYLQTGQARSGSAVVSVIGTGSDTTPFTLQNKDGSVASLRKYVVRIYFISPCTTAAGATCTASDDGGNPAPTLKRLELSTNGAGATVLTMVPLAEGIDNLQLDYGLDSATAPDGAPHTFTTAPASPTDWSNVMAVRVNLLARNTDSSPGYVDSKTYYLGLAGNVGPFNDGFKRHAFSALIRATNPSGRREQ